MYRATTHYIQVTVEPDFLAEQSEPDEHHYVWAYTIEIENLGREPVQLRHRHWIITDAQGREQEVRGAGVVGEQPILEPGESFTYTSGAPLTTPSGFMRGHYQMQTEGGDVIEVEIPAFSLDSPFDAARVH